MGAEFVEMIGGPIKMIYGYKGTGEILAAFARGESQVTTCLERRLNRLFPELVKNRRLVPLFWWNARPRDKWLKQLGGPAPHNILELPNLEPTETQRLAFVTATKIHQFLRAFMLPPGTPGPLVNAWRKAFKVTIEDPEFIKAADIAGYDVGYGSPEEYRRQFDTIRGLSPEGVKNFQYLVGQR